jgi:hypothetical protein
VGDYTISQGLGILNGGYRFRDQRITVGANAKMYYYHVPEDLAPDQDYLLLAYDLGVLKTTDWLKNYVGPEPSMSFGVALRNLGFNRVMEHLPTEVHLGVSYRPLRRLLVSSQVCLPLYEPLYGALGAEYDFDRTYFLRAGVQIKANPMFSLGFGYRRGDLKVNVAYTPTLAFYNMLSVSVSWDFGRTRKEQQEEQIEEMLRRAFGHFQKKEYSAARDVLSKVLEFDPSNRRAKRLQEMIKLQMSLDEQTGSYSGEDTGRGDED